jgi:hypothetical protein
MTYCRKTSNVKRETPLGKIVTPKASFVKRSSFRNLNVSRFTFHEQRGLSQAGR